MIEGSYKFVSLTTNSINTRSINTIPFGDIYLRSKAGKISGEKKIGTMKTNTLETAVLNQVCTYRNHLISKNANPPFCVRNPYQKIRGGLEKSTTLGRLFL